jgi:hypothetical protein
MAMMRQSRSTLAQSASGDEVVHHFAIGGEPAQRLLFILGDKPAVADDVGGQDRCYLALHDMRPAETRAAAEWVRTRRGATGFRARTAPAAAVIPANGSAQSAAR